MASLVSVLVAIAVTITVAVTVTIAVTIAVAVVFSVTRAVSAANGEMRGTARHERWRFGDTGDGSENVIDSEIEALVELHADTASRAEQGGGNAHELQPTQP